MRYKKFIIRNYRAISGPLVIDLDKKSLVPIIGINESGKTTILHAIYAFDCFNDNFNEGGRHLEDTVNLYRTSSPQATIEAIIEIDFKEFKDILSDLVEEKPELKSKASKVRRKELPSEFSITRNLVTKKYHLNGAAHTEFDNLLATEIIRNLPYILFFDDFRDKVDEKIEIQDKAPSAWLSIIEQLFKKTDKSLSVFDLPKLEERQRKTVLAKVKRKLNETLTKEWQNFRLDDRDALEISIDFVPEQQGVPSAVKNFIKLDIIETDQNGDEHYFFISDRSKGFYWFFNFVMKLEFNPKIIADGENTIYLLDEPGSYLHASAQRKLCAKLNQLSKYNRVVYCTHSHYLLDPDQIPITTITVADKDGNGNIKLLPIHDYHEPALTKRSAIQPVIDALKIKPFLMDINGDQVIITEGIYDYFALEIFKNNRSVTVLPSVNADSIKFYISLMIAWQVDFRAMWDFDDEGRNKFEKASEIFGDEIAKNKLRMLPSNGKKNKILQNLFDGNDMTMLRSELELSSNSSFERVLHTFFYSDRREELLNKIGPSTKKNFEDVFANLNL